MAENEPANQPTNQHGDMIDEGFSLLVNPGGRVVAVSDEHAEQLLESGEGFKRAPKGAQEGDSIAADGTPVHAQNELVPFGSSEEDAKKAAELQGTPENVRKQAAEDPTNDTHVAPNQNDMDTPKNDQDPGAGGLGASNTDNGDHPNTSGQPNSTPADESVVAGDASTGNAHENPPADPPAAPKPGDDANKGTDNGEQAKGFFGRRKK